ncbi:MAG: cell division protein ZapE [Betaproteobacteria bacterium]|nr:cell division protein ZapE [Betaproteobacteria bacterium]
MPTRAAAASAEAGPDSLEAAFERHALDSGFSLDDAQRRAVRHFARLHHELVATPRRGMLRRWFQPEHVVRGLYLWGGVGRGKSFLMDTFFAAARVEPRRRVHFHRFMQEIHGSLRELQGRVEPMQEVAARVASGARLLCLDEFQVTDIGDAMLMRKLLEGLIGQGVSIVTTSNTRPDQLYLHGLQRAQFLPAIALIESRFDVVHMDDGTDYRQVALEKAGTYRVPAGDEADADMARMFQQIAAEPGVPDTLSIEGRPVPVRRHAGGVAWFGFEALCDGPRAQADYIELARRYHTVFVSGVPVFAPSGESDRMRRFTWMVDEFYDRRVKLIMSAAADPLGLYSRIQTTAEQDRTASRLIEMQTHRYLGEPHLG